MDAEGEETGAVEVPAEEFDAVGLLIAPVPAADGDELGVVAEPDPAGADAGVVAGAGVVGVAEAGVEVLEPALAAVAVGVVVEPVCAAA